jgi:two-component sensor histidine kinase
MLLVASELVSNVVAHAPTDFVVRLASENDRIRIEVSDGSSIIPAVRDLRVSGFGLRIVEALSDRWGIESSDSGKDVWAEFHA